MYQANPILAELVSLLNPAQREAFEERAGIREFDGNQTRHEAECMALLEVLHRHPGALMGVTALQLDISGVSHWALTTDPDLATQRVQDRGGRVVLSVAVIDLPEIVRTRFSGLALLGPLG